MSSSCITSSLFHFIFRTQIFYPSPGGSGTQGKHKRNSALKGNTTAKGKRFSLECLKLFARQHIKTARITIKIPQGPHCPTALGAEKTVHLGLPPLLTELQHQQLVLLAEDIIGTQIPCFLFPSLLFSYQCSSSVLIPSLLLHMLAPILGS